VLCDDEGGTSSVLANLFSAVMQDTSEKTGR
jgi:hypothetical protein